MTRDPAPKTRVTLCTTCPAGKAGFGRAISEAIAAQGLSAKVTGVDCMSGCTRPSTIAFRAAGKTAYLFGDITADDLPDILTFLRHYQSSPDGNFSDARILGGLRLKAIARIPG